MTIRLVFVPLTDQEKLAFLDELLVCRTQIQNLEEAIAFQKNRTKEEVKKLDAEMNHLFEILRSGKEERELDVDEVYNEQTLEVELRSVMTGELVLSRPMTQAEIDQRQNPGLPFEAAAPDPDPDDDDDLDVEVEEDEDKDDEDDEPEPDVGQRYPSSKRKSQTERMRT